MSGRTARALAIAGALVVSAPAVAAETTVTAQFAAFAPSQVSVLPGETVRWQNVSERTHTVTADDGSFFSGEVPGGASFAEAFPAAGQYAYHCSLHPSMTGTVVVGPILLDPLPPAAVPAGDPVEFSGRTATPAEPVRIERGDATVATAHPAPDGAWRVEVPARMTGEYRAVTSAGASEPRPLLVSDRKVLVRRTRHHLAVRIVPPLPYGRVLLELYLPEHFGWWPWARRRVDYLSEASFRIDRRVAARVLLVARDGWTPLATSRVIRPAGRGQ